MVPAPRPGQLWNRSGQPPGGTPPATGGCHEPEPRYRPPRLHPGRPVRRPADVHHHRARRPGHPRPLPPGWNKPVAARPAWAARCPDQRGMSGRQIALIAARAVLATAMPVPLARGPAARSGASQPRLTGHLAVTRRPQRPANRRWLSAPARLTGGCHDQHPHHPPLRLRAAQTAQAGPATQPSGNETGGLPVASVAVLLGLALTAYSAAELIAPNTPVAASAPACPGAPVYGARFFAQTADLGANARSGPGREYAQANRYAANCTLGFDGYCVGSVEQDLRLKTPDDRWLIVHGRPNQVVSSAVVIDQSPERDLGQDPSNACKKMGGLSLPHTVNGLSYNVRHSMLSSEAPGAPAVGYALVALAGGHPSYVAIGLATAPPRFELGWTVATSLAQIPDYSASDKVWVGAAVCLADTFPSLSLFVRFGLPLARAK